MAYQCQQHIYIRAIIRASGVQKGSNFSLVLVVTAFKLKYMQLQMKVVGEFVAA